MKHVEFMFEAFGFAGLAFLVAMVALPVAIWCAGWIAVFCGKFLKPWWDWWLPNFWP